MSKKTIILSESMVKQLFVESAVNDVIKSNDFEKKVKEIMSDTLKSDKKYGKDFEKKVRKIVADSISTLFRTLWQRKNFYEDSIKNDLL